MSQVTRQVYVISDLHLGGTYPENGKGRGFRINTRVNELTAFVHGLIRKPASNPKIELVINGDAVDFLAEKEPEPPFWRAFTADPLVASHKLQAIIERDRDFFDALAEFLERGHRLTILLGNHDIELGLPPVRRTLEAALRSDGCAYQLIYNGEAYTIGDALIEHGNRYDRFNVVNYDWLRKMCSLHSRRQQVESKDPILAPAGSSMVSWVINPIKQHYGFVDLLKPPVGHTVPLLLALEPGYRKILATVAKISLQTRAHGLRAPAMPSFGGDIGAFGEPDDLGFGSDIGSSSGSLDSDDPLEKILNDELGSGAKEFLQEIETASTNGHANPVGEDISAMDALACGKGLLGMLVARSNGELSQRLVSLWKALRALQSDQTFDRAIETETDYLEAARHLSTAGFRFILFGHTHSAKRVPLGQDHFYMNSGSWTDFMRLPPEILHGTDAGFHKLKDFVEAIRHGDLERWTCFEPTYIRLDVGADGLVAQAELCDYTGPESV